MEVFSRYKTPIKVYTIYVDNHCYISTINGSDVRYMTLAELKDAINNEVISILWNNPPEVDYINVNNISVDDFQQIIDYIKQNNDRYNLFKYYLDTSKYKNIFNYILDNGNAVLFKDYDDFILQDFLNIYINLPMLYKNLGCDNL